MLYVQKGIKQVFSTAAPFQTSVDIHVLQGERPMAKDNKTIGKFKLKGIQWAPAGVPQIEVTFDIDTNGILTVSAQDKNTGKAQSITITANDKMSDAEIEQAIRDAEMYAASDQVYRNSTEVIYEARKLISETERAIEKAGKQLDKSEKKQIKNDVAALSKSLMKCRAEKMTESDIANLRSAMAQLESSSAHVRSAFGE